MGDKSNIELNNVVNEKINLPGGGVYSKSIEEDSTDGHLDSSESVWDEGYMEYDCYGGYIVTVSPKQEELNKTLLKLC